MTRSLLATVLACASLGCGPEAIVLEPVAQWLSSRFGSYYAPSEGMLPTLRIDEQFFVDLREYSSRAPERGEVVVFALAREGSGLYPPDERPELPTEYFIKRIVAIPGDTIELRKGVIVLDGQPVGEAATGETLVSLSGRDLSIHTQELDTGSFEIARDPDRRPSSTNSIEVPEGRYYLLGDNRTNSRDSRHFGTVHRDALLGPVTGVYLSGWKPTWRRINP